jgi:molecular chaperone DnaJ
MARRSIVGTMMSVVDCPDCEGEGSVVVDPCSSCDGRGVEYGQRTVTVEIPAGVSTGTRLRLSGRGEAVGRTGRTGDLQVEMQVEPDERFERSDIDLIHRIEVSAVEATLGTQKKIPLLEGGSETLDIPPGTQPGSLIHMTGYGIPRLGRSGRGDLIVAVDVRIPTSLSDDERGLLVELSKLDGTGSPDQSGIDS